MCLAEWEEHIAGVWTPFHATRGFDAGASAVTVMSVTSGPHQVVDFYTTDPDELCRLIAQSMHGAYNAYFPMVNECLVVIGPEHFATLSRGGYTKEKLQQKLWHYCNKDMAPELRRVVERRLPPVVGSVIGYSVGILARALNLVTGGGLGAIPKFDTPQSFHIVVAGAPAGKFSAFCPGFGIGRPPMPSAKLSTACSRGVNDAPAFHEVPITPEDPEALLDPRSGEVVLKLTRSPRSGKMQGPLGLLDISKPGGGVLLQQLARRFREVMPDLEVKSYTKPTFSRPASSVRQHPVPMAFRASPSPFPFPHFWTR